MIINNTKKIQSWTNKCQNFLAMSNKRLTDITSRAEAERTFFAVGGLEEAIRSGTSNMEIRDTISVIFPNVKKVS